MGLGFRNITAFALDGGKVAALKQGWNRYSYVGNSPVNFTDPSGYWFLGCFWNKVFKAIGSLFRRVPLLAAAFRIAAPLLCGPAAPACAVLASAFVAGVTSGSLGEALKAGLIAAVTAGAFKVVGNITGHAPNFATPAHLANIAGHQAFAGRGVELDQAQPDTPARSGCVSVVSLPKQRRLVTWFCTQIQARWHLQIAFIFVLTEIRSRNDARAPVA